MLAWYEDTASRIFTYHVTKLRKDFPGIVVNRDVKPFKPSEFPAVFYNVVSIAERGEDLNNQTINAVEMTLEVTVYTNTNLPQNKEISGRIVSLFKDLGFKVPMMPAYENSGNIYVSISRYRRVIGAGDEM